MWRFSWFTGVSPVTFDPMTWCNGFHICIFNLESSSQPKWNHNQEPWVMHLLAICQQGNPWETCLSYSLLNIEGLLLPPLLSSPSKNVASSIVLLNEIWLDLKLQKTKKVSVNIAETWLRTPGRSCIKLKWRENRNKLPLRFNFKPHWFCMANRQLIKLMHFSKGKH